MISLRLLMVVALLSGSVIGFLGPHVYHYVQSRLATNPQDEVQAALDWLDNHQNSDETWTFALSSNDSTESPVHATTCIAGPVFLVDHEQDTKDRHQQ